VPGYFAYGIARMQPFAMETLIRHHRHARLQPDVLEPQRRGMATRASCVYSTVQLVMTPCEAQGSKHTSPPSPLAQ
jgi:hypothetical protein